MVYGIDRLSHLDSARHGDQLVAVHKAPIAAHR